jgi:lipopolysaccharide export system protein LptC
MNAMNPMTGVNAIKRQSRSTMNWTWRLRERLPVIASITMLTILAGMTGFLAQRAAREHRSTAPASHPERPDWFIEGFNLVRFGLSEQITWQITAQRMQHRPQDDSVELVQPVLVRLEPGRPTLVIRAQEAKALEMGDLTHLRGQVVLTRAAEHEDPALKIETEQLDVLAAKDLASAEGPVRIERGRSNLTGVGLEFDNASRRLQLLAEVRGQWVNTAPSPLLNR